MMQTFLLACYPSDCNAYVHPIMKKHLLHVLKKIKGSTYCYSKTQLTIDYLFIVVRSYYYHKLNLGMKEAPTIHTAALLGFKIHFYSFSEFIDLVEEIFIFQVYRFETTFSSPTIIDCGSNIGLSILYFKKIYPTASVLAFEPDYHNYEQLKRNIEGNNLLGITLHKCALSADVGIVDLYHEISSGSLRSSLHNKEGKKIESVVSQRLSEYITNDVEVVKIDVEGAEIEIIQDLLRSGKINNIKLMIIEFHPAITKIALGEFVNLFDHEKFSCISESDKLHPNSLDCTIRVLRI
jgi:FkbM family methyltransferase